MKRLVIFLLLGAACFGIAAYQSVSPPPPELSGFLPPDAALVLQARDFASLLDAWNKSSEKQQWLKSANFEVFSRSSLFLRLQDAANEFQAAAGLPPDMDFLAQVAGSETVFALHDIGKLQFVAIMRLPSAKSIHTALWQSRSKFETRSAGGITFYFRRDPKSGREVAFASSGDLLLLATREDLMAGALQLMAGSNVGGQASAQNGAKKSGAGETGAKDGSPNDRSIRDEAWWSRSVTAAGPPGNLRMVLNLEKLAGSPYLRSYWVQQNITDMKQYSAALSGLFISHEAFREERVLLKKESGKGSAASGAGAQAVAVAGRLVPNDAVFFEAKADPFLDFCFGLLQTKILAPRLGPAPPSTFALQVSLTGGETGAAPDLETRIDQPPTPARRRGYAA
ncbi:MAG TPA: hypothetical protein VGV68_11765 [Terriglobia bacterium]|nr:hypothetical protein [Terriglobia bacterium]